MKLVFIAALLALWVAPMGVSSCQTVLRVKKEAINYACQTQRQPLQDAFKLIKIPLAIGTNLLGSVLKFVGVQVLDVKLPEIDVKLMPNTGVQVSIDSGLQISGNILLVGKIGIKVETGVLADLRITRTKNGLPVLSISACKSAVGKIKVTGGLGLLSSVTNLVTKHIEGVLDDCLCVSVSNVFLRFNSNLALMFGLSAVDKNIGMQYTMPSPPVVSADYMDVNMNMVNEVHGKVIQIPNGSKGFTLPPGAGNADSMVNMGLSQDYFISIFTAFQTSGGFDIEIPSTSASVGSYLTTSALGSYISQVNQKYKTSLPLNIKIIVDLPPVVTLQSKKLSVQISPSVEVYVMSSANQELLMTLSVDIALISRLDVNKGELKLSVTLNGEPKITILSSSFEKCKPKASALTGYFIEIFQKEYLAQINAALSVGVSLPSLPNVKLINEVIEVNEGYAVMSCDVEYVK